MATHLRGRLVGWTSAILILVGQADLRAQSPTTRVVFDPQQFEQVAIKPSSAQIKTELSREAAAPGIVLSAEGGPDGYPGIELTPKTGTAWDLSPFGHVAATVTNLGAKPVGVHLRIDNDADWQLGPTNSESVYLAPGKSGTITIIFGYSYGKKPSYPLKSSAVVRMLVFLNKSAEAQSIRIESITAAGPAGEKPPVDPASIRVRPTDGYLFGGAAPFELTHRAIATDGAEFAAANNGKSLRLRFSKPGQSVTLKPTQGAWDLRGGNQVRVKIKNVGAVAALPVVRVTSAPGPTDKAAPQSAIAPGQSAEIVASFIPAVPWTGVKDASKTEWNPTAGTGTKFVSDAATGVTFSVESSDKAIASGTVAFDVESIILAAPSVDVPEWLGKRPPVEGEWTPTFQEEFDGTAIDLTKWNIHTANYWDKLSHFSKDNVLVADGKAVLRYERKRGRHNDDPAGKETDYATGFIDTYGKWVQRYGYFEARMKIPQAPGLWPAMWLMPDRGLSAGEQWQRADTGRGAMEFDIMEYLSRWGVYRYNIAFHWDGYGKEHQQTGTQTIYVDHDRDGYITTGLLWLPGQAAIYNNGKLVAQWESPRISSVASDLMFTHVMGGWDNNALDDAQLPADFVIDYVRCWQRKDLASPADGVKSTQPTTAGPTKPDVIKP